MTNRRLPRMGALRLRLLTGAALVIGAPLSQPAFAQEAPVSASAQPAAATPQTPGADGLTPDAVFVDDLPVNVEAARELGLIGIVFTGAADLRTELDRLGVLPA